VPTVAGEQLWNAPRAGPPNSVTTPCRPGRHGDLPAPTRRRVGAERSLVGRRSSSLRVCRSGRVPRG
jgi:hypothetical protein